MNLVIGSKALATGTVNAITATFSPAPTLADETLLWLKCIGANTGPVTFSPNGLTVRPITKNSGVALEAGDISGDGFIAILWYDLANTRWVLLNPKVSAVNLTLAQVLANGTSTGNQLIESPDGNSFLSIINDEASIGWFGGVISVTDLALAVSKYYALRPSTGDHEFVGSGVMTLNGDQLATQSYADGLVAGLLDDRGSYDASSNVFPSAGGSGAGGSIKKGDIWYISVAGTLGGTPVTIGDSVRALIDAPGQTSTNWSVLETNIGYVPENVANKSTDVNADQASNIKYPSVKAVYDWAVNLFTLTATNFGAFIASLTDKTTPVDGDYIGLMDSAAGNILKKLSWANIKVSLNSLYVSLSGSYANPAWIASLAWSKITGTPTTVSGYGITDAIRLIHKNNTGQTPVTGTTANTISYAVSIPGNTFSVGDIPEVMARNIATGITGGKTMRIYVNTSNSLSGANLIGTVGFVTTNLCGDTSRRLSIISSTVTEVIASGTSSSPADFVSNSAVTTYNIDWTQTQWFIFAVQLSSALDTAQNSYSKITN